MVVPAGWKGASGVDLTEKLFITLSYLCALNIRCSGCIFSWSLSYRIIVWPVSM